jgi:ribosomal protein L37E
MESLAIYGLSPRPDAAYRVARDRARQPSIHTRADTTSIACPSCGSTIWDNDYGHCPSCGFERTRNGHAVLDQRSTNTRCGMCGSWAWPNCRLYGLRAQRKC